MRNEKKLQKVNELLSKWVGASAEFLRFEDSPHVNRLTLGLFLNDNKLALKFGACQYIRGNVYLSNTNFYCESTEWDGVKCYLIKDRNSDFELVVGANINAGGEMLVPVLE